jgi:hypothetical protein
MLAPPIEAEAMRVPPVAVSDDASKFHDASVTTWPAVGAMSAKHTSASMIKRSATHTRGAAAQRRAARPGVFGRTRAVTRGVKGRAAAAGGAQTRGIVLLSQCKT